MKKCIILSRVSTNQQDLVQQTNALIAKAKAFGYNDDSIIVIEDKESAIKLDEDERNGLNDMKHYISNGDIDAVFIWEITRISRQLPMLYSIRNYLQANHVQLYCTTPEFVLFNSDWSISDVSNMVFAMFAVMAENEMKVKRERFARGRARAIELGKAIHLPLFGYRIGTGKYLEPDPVNSKIIKEIFESYVNEEITIRQLANRYIANGTFTNNNVYTLTQRFAKWLKNEAFIGKKPYPAIISKSLFERAHKKAQYNKEKIRKGKFAETDEVFLCKNLVYMMGTNYKVGTTGKIDKKYKRTGESRGIPKPMPSIHKDALDPLVYSIAVRVAKEVTNKRVLKEKLEKQEKELHRCKLVCVVKMKQVLDKIDKVEERLIEGNLSQHKADELIGKYKEEHKRLVGEHEKYEEEIYQTNEQLSNLAVKKDIDYDNLSDRDKYDLIHKYIKRIDLIRPKLMVIRIHILDVFNKYYCYDFNTRKTNRDYGYKLVFEGFDFISEEIEPHKFYRGSEVYEHKDTAQQNSI